MKRMSMCYQEHATGLFRRNTIAPKMLSKYALSVGNSYLAELLQPLVTNICNTAKNLEVRYMIGIQILDFKNKTH